MMFPNVLASISEDGWKMEILVAEPDIATEFLVKKHVKMTLLFSNYEKITFYTPRNLSHTHNIPLGKVPLPPSSWFFP